ncbi:hypothetical protein [Mesoplasma photuris]|uniref:hypothetical protein n=1 Tax=Mesoplasma photuris TaxID=217731 RepID=UPI0004E1B19F|nr:hypothetical protein [Mesoplasma photuris]
MINKFLKITAAGIAILGVTAGSVVLYAQLSNKKYSSLYDDYLKLKADNDELNTQITALSDQLDANIEQMQALKEFLATQIAGLQEVANQLWTTYQSVDKDNEWLNANNPEGKLSTLSAVAEWFEGFNGAVSGITTITIEQLIEILSLKGLGFEGSTAGLDQSELIEAIKTAVQNKIDEAKNATAKIENLNKTIISVFEKFFTIPTELIAKLTGEESTHKDLFEEAINLFNTQIDELFGKDENGVRNEISVVVGNILSQEDADGSEIMTQILEFSEKLTLEIKLLIENVTQVTFSALEERDALQAIIDQATDQVKLIMDEDLPELQSAIDDIEGLLGIKDEEGTEPLVAKSK